MHDRDATRTAERGYPPGVAATEPPAPAPAAADPGPHPLPYTPDPGSMHHILDADKRSFATIWEDMGAPRDERRARAAGTVRLLCAGANFHGELLEAARQAKRAIGYTLTSHDLRDAGRMLTEAEARLARVLAEVENGGGQTP